MSTTLLDGQSTLLTRYCGPLREDGGPRQRYSLRLSLSLEPSMDFSTEEMELLRSFFQDARVNFTVEEIEQVQRIFSCLNTEQLTELQYFFREQGSEGEFMPVRNSVV